MGRGEYGEWGDKACGRVEGEETIINGLSAIAKTKLKDELYKYNSQVAVGKVHRNLLSQIELQDDLQMAQVPRESLLLQ